MNVYFATVVRSAPVNRSGELVQLDWHGKKVLHRRPLVPTNPDVQHDPNPRGGTRGGRGVLVNEREVVAASYHSLHLFTRDLKPIRQVSHPSFSNLHELAWDRDAIWVSSSGADAAFKVDRDGNVLESWWATDDPVVAKRFGLVSGSIGKADDIRLRFPPQAIANSAPDQVHLNAVAVHGGRPLMLLNRFGCLVRLNPTEILFEDRAMRGCHNVLVTRCGHLIISDSHHMAVQVYDASGSLLRRLSLADLPPVRRLLRRAAPAALREWLRSRGRPHRLFRALFRAPAAVKPIWVRGLAETGRGTVLVGISPASILEIDYQTGQLRDFFSYSSDLRVCIHGLACG